MNVPFNESAERVLLGAALLDPVYLDQIQEKLRADDLYIASHQRILLRMSELQRAGSAIDIVTLNNILTAKGELHNVGGTAYLAGLTEGIPRRPVIDDYIAIVKDCAVRRRVMQACGVATAQAENGENPGADVIGKLQYELDSIVNSQSESSDLESVGQWLAVNDVFAKREPGIMTGIDDYDELTYGLHKGEMTIVAARTAMGKTSHACSLTWQIAKRGKGVAVFLNEQQKASFIGRMLCAHAGVSFKAYRRGNMDWVERQYVEDAVKEFKTLPIYWDSRPSITVPSIRARSRKLHRTGDVDAIIIDQLSGISDEGFRGDRKRGDEVIGEKCRAIQAIGLELGLPVILYHQLSRESLKAKDMRPTLAHLQDSGKIEQIADNVDFLHRPRYYDPKSEEDDEIIRAKCRDGELGIVKCEFTPWCCRWSNRKGKR